MSTEALEITVSGIVQGVGYRPLCLGSPTRWALRVGF